VDTRGAYMDMDSWITNVRFSAFRHWFHGEILCHRKLARRIYRPCPDASSAGLSFVEVIALSIFGNNSLCSHNS
jgi:hypothetical protein